MEDNRELKELLKISAEDNREMKELLKRIVTHTSDKLCSKDRKYIRIAT